MEINLNKLDDSKKLKRIQSRVLVEELSLEDYERVAGGGCTTTTSGGCSGGSAGVRCKVGGDLNCSL